MAKIELASDEEKKLFEEFRKQQAVKANIESIKEEIKEEWGELKAKAEEVRDVDPKYKAPWVLEVGADPQRYVRPVVEYLQRKPTKEATEGEIIGSFTDTVLANKVKAMLENWRTQKVDEDTGVPLMDKGKPAFPRSPCLYDSKTGIWKLKPKQ